MKFVRASTPAKERGNSMFFWTVRKGIELKNWNMKPMWWSLMLDGSRMTVKFISLLG